MEKENTGIKIKLGDIIQIFAPNHTEIHEKIYLIDYINDERMVLIDYETLKELQLTFNKNGVLQDESIEEIHILQHPEKEGYARQNGLLPKVWVDVYFGGEFPTIITGEIVNLEEDQIELTTFPDLKTIYIDFEYKGLPENIPIKEFIIRNRPSFIPPAQNTEPKEDLVVSPEEEIENLNDNIETPEILTNYLNAIEEEEEELEDIVLEVELPENQKRYGVELQANELYNVLISAIPNTKRTPQKIQHIHSIIERFKQLRKMFSKFDENGNINGYTVLGSKHKPIIEHIKNLDEWFSWIYPTVLQKKTIYDDRDDETEDVNFKEDKTELSNLEEIFENYRKNTIPNSDNKYNYFISQINTIFNPIEATNVQELTKIQPIQANMDVLVNNFEDYYSTTISKDFLKRSQYVIQRYLGEKTEKKANVNMKLGKNIFTKKSFIVNEPITIKSFIMMPEPVVKFSHIHLPNSNILTKSNLHQNFISMFRFFHKKTSITPYIVDNLNDEIKYGFKDDPETDAETPQFITNIKEYLIDEKLQNEPNFFEKFLNIIFPNTRTLFKIIKKYIQHKLSFVEIIKELEPFLIYTKDITYQQYNEIRFFLKHRITELFKQINEKKKSYNQLNKIIKYYTINHLVKPFNVVAQILNQDKNWVNMLNDAYSISPNDLSYSIFTKINKMDGSQLFGNMITVLVLKYLQTPDNIVDTLLSPKLMVKENICKTRIIVKRYKNIQTLNQDNSKNEIVIDPEFDKTPYDILNQYTKEQIQMPSFMEKFLIKDLMEKFKFSKEIAGEQAQIIMNGKRKVKNGEFAVLEDGEETVYYRRNNNKWVKEMYNVPDNFVDNNQILCNMDPECFGITDDCYSQNQVKRRLLEMEQYRMKNGFQTQIYESISIMENRIKTLLEENFKLILKKKQLQEFQQEKFCKIAFEIGFQQTTDKTQPIIKLSPYIHLRDLILGQEDFTKKQQDILQFVNTFARSPLSDDVSILKEKPYWYYCKETNTPLFPKSLFQLAEKYNQYGIEGYFNELEQKCREIGVLSDDGDSVVDKHSGFILKKIDFVTEELYTEEGFKIISHAVMEENTETHLTSKKQNDIFMNDENKVVYNITEKICIQMGVPIVSVQDFILQNVPKLMAENIQTVEEYEKIMEENNKNKNSTKLPTYEEYKNRSMFWIICGCILVSIQTAVPSFKIKKEVMGCNRAFGGFPLNDNQDMVGIKYISCILYKLKNEKYPWNAIKKLKLETYETRIREILENVIMMQSNIQEKYLKKEEYTRLSTYTENEIPKEYSIEKWNLFLPPSIPIHLDVNKYARPVSQDFERDLMKQILQGHRSQRTNLMIIQSKFLYFGYAIIDCIHEIVKNNELLLKTASQIPFLENNCCEDGDQNPMTYFISKNNILQNYLNSSVELSKFFREIQKLSKANIVFHKEFTGIYYQKPTVIMEDIIYSAFFYYCNFDNEIPIPTEYENLCREKPSGYNSGWSLVNKINYLKENGKKFTETNFAQLMQIVRNKNRIQNRPPTNTMEPLQSLLDILDEFNITKSAIFSEQFCKDFRAVISTYNPDVMVMETRPELKQLKISLVNSIQKMYHSIMVFMQSFGNMNSTQFDKFQQKVLNKFVITRGNTRGHIQLIKNNVCFMGSVLPSIITNSQIWENVPKHWDLFKDHQSKIKAIISNNWLNLKEFFGEKILEPFFIEITQRLEDLLIFIQELPCYSKFEKNNQQFYAFLDDEATQYLYLYLWYSTIYQYVICAENREFQKIDLDMKRAQKKLNKTQNENPNEYILDEIYTTEETEEFGMRYLISKLIIQILDIEFQEQSVVLMDYPTISKKVEITRKVEKKKITDYLGKMNPEEREIETQNMRFKMGKWQEKTFNYKNTYADWNETTEGNGVEIDLEENDEPMEDEENFGDEGEDIGELGENYQDGEYYPEDQDPDNEDMFE
jgi:hypothetical protein